MTKITSYNTLPAVPTSLDYLEILNSLIARTVEVFHKYCSTETFLKVGAYTALGFATIALIGNVGFLSLRLVDISIACSLGASISTFFLWTVHIDSQNNMNYPIEHQMFTF